MLSDLLDKLSSIQAAILATISTMRSSASTASCGQTGSRTLPAGRSRPCRYRMIGSYLSVNGLCNSIHLVNAKMGFTTVVFCMMAFVRRCCCSCRICKWQPQQEALWLQAPVAFSLAETSDSDAIAVTLTNKQHFQSTDVLQLRWRLLADGIPLRTAEGCADDGWATLQHEPVRPQVPQVRPFQQMLFLVFAQESVTMVPGKNRDEQPCYDALQSVHVHVHDHVLMRFSPVCRSLGHCTFLCPHPFRGQCRQPLPRWISSTCGASSQ